MDRFPSDGSGKWHGFDFSNIYGQDYYIEFDTKGRYTLFQQNKKLNPEYNGAAYVIVSTGKYERIGRRYNLLTDDYVEGRFEVTEPKIPGAEEVGECLFE
jgi:hypothetical protein